MDKKVLASLEEHPVPNECMPVKYIITASVHRIDNKGVLFLSFFDTVDIKHKASFKLYLCKDGYLTQKLQDDGSYKWSSACLRNLLDWHYLWPRYDSKLLAGCFTLGDRIAIQVFTKKKCQALGDELEAIFEYQERIMAQRLQKKHEKILNIIDEAMAKVPPLPNNFRDWVYNGPFGFSRYIYYKRTGSKINVFCTACRKDFIIPETAQTKKRVKHNNTGRCPKCNKKVVFKAVGKTTRLYDTADFAIIQRYDCNSLVVRYFHGSIEYMDHFRHPKLNYYEIVREIHSVENGKPKTKKYEMAIFRNTGEYRWCDDRGKVYTPKAYLYTRNLNSVLKGTKWQYSGLYDFAKKIKVLRVHVYLRTYITHPAIEYLVKFRLFNFLDDKLNGHCGYYWDDVNITGKSIKEVFGLDKTMFRQMQRLDLDKEGLILIRDAVQMGKPLSDQQVKWVLKNVEIEHFIKMLNYSTSHKIIKYIKQQSNKDYAYKNVLIDWCDYIGQCKQLGFDLNNTFVIFPRNLKDKHEEYTILCQAKGLEKYNKEVEKAYRLLDKLYSYSDKNYIIRPASNVKEIVREGHQLRHCVANINYVSGVANKKRAIMLIRKKEDPDTPYYTLELDLETLHVMQCRGYKNDDMTDDVKKFVEKWKHKKLTARRIRNAV